MQYRIVNAALRSSEVFGMIRQMGMCWLDPYRVLVCPVEPPIMDAPRSGQPLCNGLFVPTADYRINFVHFTSEIQTTSNL